MHSMTAALAAHTMAPPDPTTQADTSGWFATAWNWSADHLPGGNLSVIGVVVILGIVAHAQEGAGATKAKSDAKGFVAFCKGIGSAVVALFKGLWSVVRFYGGREMHGEPRSDATFWRAGTKTTDPRQILTVAELGSIAAAGPRVSLVKPARRQPSHRARQIAQWIDTYQGRAARALDVAVQCFLWLVWATGKLWRGTKRVYGWVKAVYDVVAPVITTVARTLAMWHRWPYAARGLARVALTAAAVGLAVPAWRAWTIALLVLGLGAVAALGHRYKPKPPTDAERYGPAIWTLLREDLGLPEEEDPAQWLLLPELLAAPDARIVVRLPWTFRGSDLEKMNLLALFNSRLPGEWSPRRWDFTSQHHSVVLGHKPPPAPPKPEPVCPDRVGFFDPDIQEAIAQTKKGQVVIGKDAFGQIIIKELGDGETPHWALSVGTGGGKSAFSQMVIAQLIRQGYHIIAVDVKRVSVENYKNVPGVHIYNDPNAPQDMRRAIDWFKDEIDARTAVKEEERATEFPGLLLLVEESNEFADISREWWDDNRKAKADEFGPAERAADPIWGTVASGARLGRFVHGNILAVFQDLRDQALGGKGLRNLFRLKFMGNYNTNQWKNVIGTTPVPDSVDKAGRMMIVEGNSQYWVQTCFAEPEELTAWALEQRAAQNFDPAAGLYGTPPAPPGGPLRAV
ncbi:hypothetical protein [Streptomyces vinaceus]|uniref:hypothetical protein n=1 Tax=Streptomyces vinaceus TaxID=1960 RepID=UPI003810E96F